MPLFVVVVTNWQHYVNLQLPTLVPLALVDDNFSIFFDQAKQDPILIWTAQSLNLVGKSLTQLLSNIELFSMKFYEVSLFKVETICMRCIQKVSGLD